MAWIMSADDRCLSTGIHVAADPWPPLIVNNKSGLLFLDMTICKFLMGGARVARQHPARA